MNEHYGKIVNTIFGGVDLELIIVEYPTSTPGEVKLWDRTGTTYRLPFRKVKGTGEKIDPDEITRIAASKFARCKERASRRKEGRE